MRTSESIKNIAAAMLAIQSELGHPKKNAKNPHLKNKFADLPNVIDTIKAVANKHGVVIIQPLGGRVTENGSQVCVCTTRAVHAESGEFFEEAIEVVVPGSKGLNMAQDYGSTGTYCRRYGASAMFFVASEPDDDGNESKESTGNSTPDVSKDFDL